MSKESKTEKLLGKVNAILSGLATLDEKTRAAVLTAPDKGKAFLDATAPKPVVADKPLSDAIETFLKENATATRILAFRGEDGKVVVKVAEKGKTATATGADKIRPDAYTLTAPDGAVVQVNRGELRKTAKDLGVEDAYWSAHPGADPEGSISAVAIFRGMGWKVNGE